ncbi:hypothetical protein NRS6186_14215 [Bacillus subtilis]|uniref:hypothetical protein n=1 Tax=Bacillus TaxID=1386 RepID=UPI0005CA34D1|nr:MULTISPECIES: hypothetical protein [Bacillus]MCY8783171.1 DUF4145 domain-containing protein [Bacillus spizizenii]MCK8098965.1 DUF4145 domain-containing protein [Bacillus sp. 2CMS4F]MCW0118118.1 DUF4145 domain-containing protein [Bacillus subtilis]MCY8420121.1 DUF4145 domain-containing protein [Bacillus inaquosorum]MCY9120539.1 DUF4145 domain-containing protein [Bacillus spizizenii]
MFVANINWQINWQEISHFISSLLNSKFIITIFTSWPLAVVIIVLLLRKGILDKLRQLDSFNYKDGTATFIKEEIDKAKALNVEVEVPKKLNDTSEPDEEPSDSKNAEGVYEPADFKDNKYLEDYAAPYKVILSWSMVESRIIEICRNYDIKLSTLYKRVKMLKHVGVISENTFKTITSLFNIRNVAEAHPNSVKKEDAYSYEALCNKVIKDLEDI